MGSADAAERRCGWLENPTPANWSLRDRDAEWLIGEQGGYQAPGIDEFPDMRRFGWVVTNTGDYGYGCACLTVTVDATSRRVRRIIKAEAISLSRCRADARLPPP